MKDGLIVYLVSTPNIPEEFNAPAAAQELGYAAHRVELVAPDQGFFTVEDAWHFLLTRGCARISLVVGQAEDPHHLRPLGPAVRLCG
ncbi:MAG: hypothetical protein A2Z73_02705 [Deltaproteobacteria bacterium RBG_13_60_28]|nr:MAG: hypothetical protein A2Z73_02705 [Deltaproteobacteria bacterium RBG_13_60_28]